ncbi:RHS repeat-associated core domain-containing protein [Sorangium sp. So ce128]|uniref:RHS repeat-associated core domain-containing protein n=1 Tax=Sorangium sp. So ce128 TaxID=3133281 RepID=UPI003F64497E
MSVVSETIDAVVNLFTGGASLELPLLARQGRNGLDLALTLFYSGQVRGVASTWNVDAPTDVAGLGWTLPLETITRAHQFTASTDDDVLYLLAGGRSTRLVRTGTDNQGRRIYAAESYQFSDIRYDPSRELWTILRDNGDTYLYGDRSADRGGLQWGVAWDNWIGATTLAARQRQVVTAWNLVEVRNRWGEALAYTYTNTESTVQAHGAAAPPLRYTRVSRLARVVGVTGERIELRYGDKAPVEYQERHTDPAPPNPWQDRLDTWYLESAALYSSDGQLLETARLSYLDDAGQLALLGSGALSKRLLTAVSVEYPDGSSFPATRMRYWGQDPAADKVSAGNIYSADTRALYGSLRAITRAEGATTTLHYARQDLSLCPRDITLAPPTRAGVTFSRPRFAFADNHVITTWFGNDNTLNVVAHAWEGRWLRADLGAVAVADADAYDAAPIATAEAWFAVQVGQQVHLFHRSPDQIGAWVQPSVDNGGSTQTWFTTALVGGEVSALAVGDRFFAVVGQTSGKLYRYRWTGAAWVADPEVTLTAEANPALFTACASQSVLVIAGKAVTSSLGVMRVWLYALREEGAWTSATFWPALSSPNTRGFTLQAGTGYAVLQATSPVGSALVQSSAYALVWDAAATALQTSLLGSSVVSSAAAAAPVLAGSSVTVGQNAHRFDGERWISTPLSTRGGGAGKALVALSRSADLALRVTGSGSDYAYDLFRYDPNTRDWLIPTGMSATGSSADVALVAPREGDNPSDFVVFANTVRYAQPDGTYTAGFPLPSPPSGADLETLQLLGSHYLIYQSGGDTLVYLLANGAVVNGAAVIRLTGQKIKVAGRGADALVGRHAFVTYAGTFDGAGFSLTLHRVVDGAVQGAQTSYPVADVQVDDGDQTVLTGIVWDAATATLDVRGLNARYNKVTTLAGTTNPGAATYGRVERYSFNGLGASEPPALPYPTGASTNAADYGAWTIGTLYATRTLDSGGKRIAGTTLDWWVTTVTLGVNARGAYLRQTRELDDLDGVETQRALTYSNLTGLVTRIDTRNYDADGAEQRVSQVFRYWWEEYDQTRESHLLTPVIQTTLSTTAVATGETTVTGITATPWRSDWGHGAGQWAPCATYRALSPSAVFSAWSGGTPPADQWRATSRVTDRGPASQVIGTLDVSGVASSTLLSADGELAVARFTNADLSVQEGSYQGFETYESDGGWAWSDPSTPLSAHVVTRDNHTGTRCLELPPTPGREVGPVNSFEPGDQQRAYVFASWVKSEPGYDPAQGAAVWRLEVVRTDDGSRVGGPYTLTIPATANQWRQLQQILDLATLRSGVPTGVKLRIDVKAFNQNTTTACLVDDVRLSPVDARFAASVYDARTRRLTATLGNNGETTRFVHDSCQRQIAEVGPEEAVRWLIAPAFSRDLTAEDRYLAEFPNTTLSLRTTSYSRYYDFHDGDVSDWTFQGGTWAITAGELTYAPGGSSDFPLGGTATLRNVAFTNFAVRITVSTAATGTAGVGNGEIYVYWDGPAAQWRLARKDAQGTLVTQLSSAAHGLGATWVFAIVEGVVSFYADGVQVFTWTYTPATGLTGVGQPVFTLAQSGSFDDLFVLDNPELSVTLQDGLGRPAQGLAFRGRQTITSGNYPSDGQGAFVDPLGRPEYLRRPRVASLQVASPPSSTAALLDGRQSTYLVSPDGQRLTRQQYLDGSVSQVLDYTTLQYEPAPTSRVTAQVAPRPVGSDAAEYTTSYGYHANSASGPGSVMNDLLPSGSQDRYHVTQSTDPNGVTTYIMTNQLGRTVARRVALESGYQTVFQKYDPAGRPTVTRTPNYYAPPDGSSAESWVISRAYDFLGLVIQETTPSAGTTRLAHDSAERPRFILDADGAARNPPRIQYNKYDRLGRLIETGVLQDAAYAWGSTALLAKLDDASFPAVSGANPPQQGAWSERYHYDVDASRPAEAELLGRLARVEINNGASPDVETFSYDASGQVTTHTAAVPGFDANTYVTDYRYDNLGRVVGVTYPRPSGQNSLQVGYYYNRLGQLAAVGDLLSGTEVIDPQHPADAGEKYYAAFTYSALGQVTTEGLNNGRGNPPGTTNPMAFTRSYTYTEQGWLSAIDDPYLTQELLYRGAGVTTPRHNGQAAALRFTYKPEKWTAAPPNEGTQYAYDRLGRVTSATSDLDNAHTLALTYDANGNISTRRRGFSLRSLSYRAGPTTPPVSDRLYSVTASTSASLDLTSLTASPPCNSGFCWGASNDGPSGSRVADDGVKGKVLELVGGSLGHQEQLTAASYLDPAGTYTLRYSVKTAPEFSGGLGTAGWVLRVFDTTGEIVTKLLEPLTDTAGAWVARTLSLDLPAVLNSLGLGRTPTRVALQCVNPLRSASGGAGPSVYLHAVSLVNAAAVPVTALTYDSDGAVTSASARGITALTYAPVSRQPATMTLADATEIRYAYDGQRRRRLDTILRDGQEFSATLTLRGVDARPLVRLTRENGETATTRYVHGATGLIAFVDASGERYALKDNLGSVRALVDGETGRVVSSLDYIPYGATVGQQGDPGRTRYASLALDAHSGLYDADTRLYDPDLGRYYSVDPTGAAGPYTYFGDDPVNRSGAAGPWVARASASPPSPQSAARGSHQGRLLPPAAAPDRGVPTGRAPGLTPDVINALSARRQELRISAAEIKRGSYLDDILRSREYNYDNYKDRTFTGVTADGRPLGKDGRPLAQGWYMYTLDTNHEFRYLKGIWSAEEHQGREGSGKYGFRQIRNHSQLSGGVPIYASGWFEIDQDGQVVSIDSASGHYKPQGISALYALEVLRDVYGLRISATPREGYAEVDVYSWRPEDDQTLKPINIYKVSGQPEWREVLWDELWNLPGKAGELTKIAVQAAIYRRYAGRNNPVVNFSGTLLSWLFPVPLVGSQLKKTINEGEVYLTMANDPTEYNPY